MRDCVEIENKYAQNRLDDPIRPGALGLGQARATKLNDAFQFIIYLSPTRWAVVADTWLGRYKTICIATALDCIRPCGTRFHY
jgi:POT family proton-dependent oligopeptide transporter